MICGAPRAYVDVLASARNGTLSVGSTINLEARISEHKQGLLRGFTKRYGVTQLVWYEERATIAEALAGIFDETMTAALEAAPHRRDESELGRPRC